MPTMPAGTKHRTSGLKLALRTANRLDRKVIASVDRQIVHLRKLIAKYEEIREPAAARVAARVAELAKLSILLVCVGTAIPACAPPSCPVPNDAGPTADVELPKPISVFIACDTFDDFVARNAERLGCGSELPECPWPRELDVRCDGAGVLETLAVVRDSVTECGNVLAVVDGAVCH